MDGNCYSRLVSVMRGEAGEASGSGETAQAGLGAAPCRMRLGIVSQRVPLKIKVAGIEQPTEVLRINERLVKGGKWKVHIKSPDSTYSGLTGQLSGPVACSGGYGSPRLSSVTGGTLHSTGTELKEAVLEQLEIDLEVGDQVLLLTEDDQVFYILMKVVRAV